MAANRLYLVRRGFKSLASGPFGDSGRAGHPVLGLGKIVNRCDVCEDNFGPFLGFWGVADVDGLECVPNALGFRFLVLVVAAQDLLHGRVELGEFFFLAVGEVGAFGERDACFEYFEKRLASFPFVELN